MSPDLPPWVWWLLAAGTSIPCTAYPFGSLGLRSMHAIRVMALRLHAGHGPDCRGAPEPPKVLHWIRRELRWFALASLPLATGASFADRRALEAEGLPAGTLMTGSDTADLAISVALLILWLVVQRWQDNRDCNCGDGDHHRRRGHRRRPTVVSRVTQLAGRLVVAPARAAP